MKMFQPEFPKRLPPDAEVVERHGKPHVRLRENGRPVYYPITKCGTKYLKKLETWYAKVKQPDGSRKAVPLSPNKEAAKIMLGQILRDAEMGRAGATNPYRDHAKTLLADHVAAWVEHQAEAGVTRKHREAAANRVRKALKFGRFTVPADLDAEPVAKFLSQLRKDREITLPDGTDLFRRREVAELLGVSIESVASAVLRHGLEVVGAGMDRRYPRATVEELARLRGQGASVRTANTYLVALKTFSSWMVDQGRMAANPFARLECGNVATDRRHDRRTLSHGECERLIRAAERSSESMF